MSKDMLLLHHSLTTSFLYSPSFKIKENSFKQDRSQSKSRYLKSKKNRKLKRKINGKING